MKRFLSAILSALAVVTLLSSCSAEKNNDENLKIEENSQIITETPDKEIPVSETEEKTKLFTLCISKTALKAALRLPRFLTAQTAAVKMSKWKKSVRTAMP